MGPLIAIALFLASFVLGSGGNGGFGFNANSPLNPAITPPVTSTLPCLPEPQTIMQTYQIAPTQGSGNNQITVEATSLPLDTGGIPGDIAANLHRWDLTIKWLYGYEYRNQLVPQLNGNGPQYDFDRRKKNFILVKHNARLPAWKIAGNSGGSVWSIPDAVWNDDLNAVYPGPTQNLAIREMSRIGLLRIDELPPYLKDRYQTLETNADLTDPEAATAIGDVWVATGWCGGQDNGQPPEAFGNTNPFNSNACADPLLIDFIFVVSKKGQGSRFGRLNIDSHGADESTDPVVKDKSWWAFDVYYDFSRQPAPYNTISYNSLPCWMGACGLNDNMMDPNHRNQLAQSGKRMGQDAVCPTIPGASVKEKIDLALINKFTVIKSFIKNTVNKSTNYLSQLKNRFISKINKDVNVIAASSAPQFFSGKTIVYDGSFPSAIAGEIQLRTYILMSETALPTTSILVGTLNYKEINYEVRIVENNVETLFLKTDSSTFKYAKVHEESDKQDTLKLDTFIPIKDIFIPTPPEYFKYEWYTPACKPAIYLYPTEETKLSVKLTPLGNITKSEPLYLSGWDNLLAKPNGEIFLNNNKYPYLYYEAEIKNVNVPKAGWVVQKEVLPYFFNGMLTLLGLNDREIADFKDYWVKKLNDKPYYFVTLLDKEYLDQIEKIEISKEPDTFLRVRFFFEGLDKEVEVAPLSIPNTPERKGFVAVDWGGMIANGSCENGVSSDQKIE